MSPYRFLITLAMTAVVVLAAAQKGRNIPFNVIEQGTNSSISKQRGFVIRSNVQYTRYIGLLGNVTTSDTPNAAPRSEDRTPNRPGINWRRNSLVAIHVSVPTGGYTMRVRSLRRVSRNRLEAVVELTRPPRSAIVTQALMTPYAILRTPPTSGSVRIRVVRKG